MKTEELNTHSDIVKPCNCDVLKQIVADYANQLSKIKERMCCENCQMFDPVSQICHQNGCNDYDDWTLWIPTKKE